MNQIAITTSQNVQLFFNTASIGSRILAFIIDWLIKGAYLLFIYYSILKPLGNYFDTMDMWSRNAVLIIFMLPVVLYTWISETLMEGQTLGKKITKIRVVKIDGYQASNADYFMRWVLRLVDVFVSGGAVGLVTALVSKYGQRLGDMATGTSVISLKSTTSIDHTIIEQLSEEYQPLYPQVLNLTDNDMRIIKNNFIKAKNLKDKDLLNQLVLKIKNVLKLEVDEKNIDQIAFLERILKDYNFYTSK